MADTLTPRQWGAVHAARKAMCDSLMAAYPGDSDMLLAILISGAFADMCQRSTASGVRALVSIINDQLREAGLQLAPLRRH